MSGIIMAAVCGIIVGAIAGAMTVIVICLIEAKSERRDRAMEKTKIKELVEALKCSSTPLFDKNKCHDCAYCAKEEINPDEPFGYDYIDGGKYYYETCDCERMALDAAKLIEKECL